MLSVPSDNSSHPYSDSFAAADGIAREMITAESKKQSTFFIKLPPYKRYGAITTADEYILSFFITFVNTQALAEQ